MTPLRFLFPVKTKKMKKFLRKKLLIKVMKEQVSKKNKHHREKISNGTWLCKRNWNGMPGICKSFHFNLFLQKQSAAFFPHHGRQNVHQFAVHNSSCNFTVYPFSLLTFLPWLDFCCYFFFFFCPESSSGSFCPGLYNAECCTPLP